MQLQRNETIDAIIFRHIVITWSSRPPTLYVAQSHDAGAGLGPAKLSSGALKLGSKIHLRRGECMLCVCVCGGGGGGGGLVLKS